MANIMNTGAQSQRDLRHTNDVNQGVAQDTDNIPVIQNPYLVGRETYYQGSMTQPQRRQSGAGDTTPFGESFWDPEGMVNDYQLEHLRNIRANNQSGLAQIGNGLLKMTTTALTTLADGTIGVLWGLGQGIANLADNDENTGFWQGLWNNDFNKAMSSIQEDMEEIAPNYYSDEQLDSPWYSAANLLSANFLGDKLLKNAGFTIGALAALAVPGFDMAWLAKGIQGGAKLLGVGAGAAENSGAIANYLARTFVSANSEASIEAINAVKDNQKSMYEGIQQRADEATRQSEQQMMQDILNGVDEQTARNNHLQRLNTIDQESQSAKAIADENLRDVGNSVWLMNVGLLSLTNGLEFGNILKGGYNLRKSLKDYGVKLTADGKEVSAREFGQAMARGTKTEITPNFPSVNGWGIAGGTLQRFSSEGVEEGAQRIISDSNEMQAQAKLQEWVDNRYNQDSNKYSLWEKQINPDITSDLVDYTKALGNAWQEGFGSFSSSGWEEVFLGGLTGMFGTAGIRQKKDGKMGIGWQGGIYESIRDQQQQYTEAEQKIQAFNEELSKPEFKQRMQHAAAALASAYDMEEALNNSDVMGYKNAEMLSIVNDAIYFRDNGMLDLFKGYYEETAKNVSAKTINNLRSQTKDAKTGKSFYDGKSDDEIRQMIQDKSKSTLEKIENTIATYEDMERQYADAFRTVDAAPIIGNIKDPVVRLNVAMSGADYTQIGIQQLTYLSALHDDLVRRKAELEQEKSEAEGAIDGADKVKKIDKGIAEIDKALNDIKNQFNKAKNNPEEMIQEMIDSQERSAKVSIGKKEQATKARYHNAQSLQDVADTFMYGNYNQSVLEQAIHEAKDEDNKKLLESFYPFSVEVNSAEKAIDTVVNRYSADETDEKRNRARAVLGSYVQKAIAEALDSRIEDGSSTNVADNVRSIARDLVDSVDRTNPIAVTGAESTAAFLEDIANEMEKARETAKVPEVKPAEEPKKPVSEKKETHEPEAGKKGEPQDAATQPEPAKKPEAKPTSKPQPQQPVQPAQPTTTKQDSGEVSIAPVAKEEAQPSSRKVGDIVNTDGTTATINQVMGNGVYEITFSDGDKRVITEKDITGSIATVSTAQPAATTSTTSVRKAGDTITMKDGSTGTITSVPKAGVYEVKREDGSTTIITDSDVAEQQPQENPPAPTPQSPTGGNKQGTQVTPNREGEQRESQPVISQGTQNTDGQQTQSKPLSEYTIDDFFADAAAALPNYHWGSIQEETNRIYTAAIDTALREINEILNKHLTAEDIIALRTDAVNYSWASELAKKIAKDTLEGKREEQPTQSADPLQTLIDWAEGKLSRDDAKQQLVGTEYVKEVKGSALLRTEDHLEFTKAVEKDLGDYLTGKYPFLTVEGVKQSTGVSTSGGDMGLLVVKDAEGNEYGTPSNFLHSLAHGGKAADVVRRGEEAERLKEEQAGAAASEVRVVEPETPEQEDKKDEVRGNKSFTGTNFLTYSQTILGRRKAEDKGVAKRRKGDSMTAYQALLTSKGIDIDHVVNNYLYEFMQDGKITVRFMVMHDDEHREVPSTGHEHLFLVTEITDKMQKLIDKDNKLQGNVKQMSDGTNMLIVGIIGYGQDNTELEAQANRIREAYAAMPQEDKNKEYTIIPNIRNSIHAISGGSMVLQFEGQDRQDVDLKTLLESNDALINPRQLKINDIRFATAIGKEGEVKLRFFQKRDSDDQYDFLNPLSLQGAPGNVWMFIRSADGNFIPTPIAPTTWGDDNMNWESELGQKIRSLVDALATVTNKEEIPALLKELNQRLVFSINQRNNGNRLFYDEKTGELSFRKFNLDAASDNAKVILGDEESPFLVVDRSESLTLNLHNAERPMEESKDILYRMIEALDPVINIQNSVMASAGGIKMYLDAGVFKVGIKSLGMVNAKTYLFPMNNSLEPMENTIVPPSAPMTTGTIATFYYNGNRYSFSGEKLYDSNFREITGTDTIEHIKAAAAIQSGQVRPIRVNNTNYWEINGRVYSQYRAGGYSQLSPAEETEYKQRKAAEAEKKSKEKAAREEAQRLEQLKSTLAKYQVGQEVNGRTIKEVNIVDGEVVYTFDDAQNGIQNGTISQTELEEILQKEQQPSTPQHEETKQPASSEVKKTEQEAETLAQKVRNSRNNVTFADTLDDDSLYDSLVSALEGAIDAHKQRTGETININFNDIDDIEKFLVEHSLLNNPSQYSISELQALVERLNSCGF